MEEAPPSAESVGVETIAGELNQCRRSFGLPDLERFARERQIDFAQGVGAKSAYEPLLSIGELDEDPTTIERRQKLRRSS